MQRELKITIPKTARYYTYGHITKARRIWFVFHGYGQLGQYFIKNFTHLNPDEDFVVAPEGFHRFYLDGNSGRVGASWMTKEARLEDIADYVHYLDIVCTETSIAERPKNVKLIVFGFSQGVATAARWIAQGKNKPDLAVLWGGAFPPDLGPPNSEISFHHLPTYCCIGDSDPYINQEAMSRIKNQLDNLNINAEWYTYVGDHRIPKEELTKFISKINI